MKELSKNCWLVFYNGTIAEVEVENPMIFTSEKKAKEYIESEQTKYPDLHYYLCKIVALYKTLNVPYRVGVRSRNFI